MRPVLAALFEWLTVDEALASLRDDSARLSLRARLRQEALAEGRLGAIPEGQYGDNLLQGLLALRTKFDRDTAMSKLELNLSMRSRGG
jgi:hypothetical protein